VPYKQPGAEIPTHGKGSKLTEKMERFVEEYMLDLNASAAVLRAGYKTRNQHRMGAELLRHPLIRQRVDELKKERSHRLELTADYLVNKLIALIEDDEIKTSDQLRAIELAGKSIALWKERQEISGPDGKAIETEQRIREDVADFTSSLARLAKRGGESEVAEFPKPGANSGA
jgi:phage terminase small subunit